jgi:hypothetical protein
MKEMGREARDGKGSKRWEGKQEMGNEKGMEMVESFDLLDLEAST